MRSDSEMSQRNHPSCTPFGLFCRRPLLVQGLSWIGGLGVLSSGFVWAQSDPSVDTIGTPTTQEAPPTVKMEINPRKGTERTVIRRRSASAPEPEPNFVRRRSAPAPAAEKASAGVRRRRLARQRALETTSVRRRRSAPEPAVVRRRSLPVSAPETSVAVPKRAKLSPPRLVEPNTISYVKPPKLRPSKAQKSGMSSSDYNNSYIDPTDYSVGATGRAKEPIRSYDEPPAVVLSERSTGCQRVLQSGQGLSGGSCGVARIPSRNTNRLGETARLTYPTRTRREYASDTDVPEALRTSGLANRRVSRARLAVNQPEREIRQQILVASASPVAIGPVRDRSKSIRSINRRSRSLGSSAVTRSTAIASNNVGTSQRSIPFNVPEYKAPIPTIFRGLANGNTSLIFPLAIPAPITSLFGWRTHPISGTRRFHAGTDVGAPLGTPVLAAFAGKVAIADWMGGYGQSVVLKHNETQETLYAHLSEILVQPGQQIEQGTVIGRVGSTGNSTGPHLHFEIRQLTQEGWMAVDSGAHLEYGLAQMIKALQTAHSAPAAPSTSSAPLTPQPGS